MISALIAIGAMVVIMFGVWTVKSYMERMEEEQRTMDARRRELRARFSRNRRFK